MDFLEAHICSKCGAGGIRCQLTLQLAASRKEETWRMQPSSRILKGSDIRSFGSSGSSNRMPIHSQSVVAPSGVALFRKILLDDPILLTHRFHGGNITTV